jgi:hypothetical protein
MVWPQINIPAANARKNNPSQRRRASAEFGMQEISSHHLKDPSQNCPIAGSSSKAADNGFLRKQ